MSANNSIEIKNLTVTYIRTKEDKFKNTRCYFKVTDTKAKQKWTPVVSQICPDCHLPLWETENIEYMLKVKQKNAPKGLVPNYVFKSIVTFKYYCMDLGDGNTNPGCYAILKVMNSTPSDEDE